MSGTGIEVTVHPERCMAMGHCRAAAPVVFGADDSGWVRLLEPRPAADRPDDVLHAAESCPVTAIDVDESPAGATPGGIPTFGGL
ncbi:ferredoxin [Micromonospora olivasterospora]|uniref:ferredoxin n=1 Tax=Micromonospora olivasterospora TaxID=1880 RepID=UPI001B88241F